MLNKQNVLCSEIWGGKSEIRMHFLKKMKNNEMSTVVHILISEFQLVTNTIFKTVCCMPSCYGSMMKCASS